MADGYGINMFWYFDESRNFKIKNIFGNYRNYQRYVEAVKYRVWKNWLISLGYREEKLSGDNYEKNM